MKYVTAILTAIGLLVVGIFFFSCLYGLFSEFTQLNQGVTTSASAPASVAAGPQLELEAASWHPEYGFAIFEGTVKNI